MTFKYLCLPSEAQSSFILSITITSCRNKTLFIYSQFTSHYTRSTSKSYEIVRSNRQECWSFDNLCVARWCWIVATFRSAMPTNALLAASLHLKRLLASGKSRQMRKLRKIHIFNIIHIISVVQINKSMCMCMCNLMKYQQRDLMIFLIKN